MSSGSGSFVGRLVAGVVLVGGIVCDADGEALARVHELVIRCRTVKAFGYAPSSAALRDALALAGTRGRTRLDLTISEGSPERARWEAPLQAARALAAARSMEAVTELVLDRFPMSVEAARVLARSPRFGALRVLSLADTGVTGAMLKELLAPPAFPALEELDLTNNRLGAADLRALGAALASRKLRRLTLGAHEATVPSANPNEVFRHDDGVGLAPYEAGTLDALAGIAATPSLEVLDVRDEKLGVAGVEALLKVKRSAPLEIATRTPASLSRKHMDEVAALDPAGRISFATDAFEIGTGGVRALDASGLLAKISTLDVKCGDACAGIIGASAHAGRLRDIYFGCEEDTPFTKATAAALARATTLGALRKLEFVNDVELCKAGGIGAEGIRALAGAPFAGALESLTLNDQNLDHDGWAALAKAASFAGLKELVGSEWEPFLTPAAARAFLRDGPLAGHLEVLSLMAEGLDWPVGELAKGLNTPRMRVLELPGGEDAGRAWMAFARHPGTQRLEVLEIDPSVDEADRDKFFATLRKHLPPDVCFP